jgi:hypothetical protein
MSAPGGICNRLNNIINGLYYYEKYSFNKKCLIWTPNSECEASFGDLFEERGFNVASNRGAAKGAHLLPARTPKDYRQESLMQRQLALLAGNEDCHIKERGSLNPDIPTQKIVEIISTRLPLPSPPLQVKIKAFLVDNNLEPKSYIGVHIRRTDGPKSQRVPTHNYARHIRTALKNNKDQKFFVCSDDSMIEKRIYAKFPSNVFIRPKRYQPHLTKSGHIQRSPEVVKEGVIDLFLLSQASRLIGSHGTYSHMAELMIKSTILG